MHEMCASHPVAVPTGSSCSLVAARTVQRWTGLGPTGRRTAAETRRSTPRRPARRPPGWRAASWRTRPGSSSTSPLVGDRGPWRIFSGNQNKCEEESEKQQPWGCKVPRRNMPQYAPGNRFRLPARNWCVGLTSTDLWRSSGLNEAWCICGCLDKGGGALTPTCAPFSPGSTKSSRKRAYIVLRRGNWANARFSVLLNER